MRPTQMSQRGVVRLSGEEWNGKNGLRDGRYYPYRDYNQAKDLSGWTIGVGHLVKGGEDFSRGLTADEVWALFHRDLGDVYSAIARHVSYEYDQSAFDSMCLSGHNLGPGFFFPARCKAIRCLNASDVPGYQKNLLDWNKSGEPLRFDPILYARRQREAAWFVEPPPPQAVAIEELFTEWEKRQTLAKVAASLAALARETLDEEDAEFRRNRVPDGDIG